MSEITAQCIISKEKSIAGMLVISQSVVVSHKRSGVNLFFRKLLCEVRENHLDMFLYHSIFSVVNILNLISGNFNA